MKRNNTDWKQTTLGEVADIIMGQSPPSSSYNEEGEGLPFFQGVRDFGEKYASTELFTNEPTKVVDTGAILFSVRAPVGEVNIVREKSCIGRGNAGLVMKNGQQEFLYHFLKGLESEIQSYTSGTVFTSISGKVLKEVRVSIPPLPEQKSIAAVLSSLDDKIELLRAQNKTLEEMAQRLFKEWFVDFNFPNEDGKPYKKSGGRMVESEMGEIPEGWGIKSLQEVFDFLEGPGIRNWQYAESGTRFINIRLINDGDINIASANFINQADVDKKYQHFLLKERDMIVSSSGTLGKSAIVRKSHLPLLLNTSVIRFRPKDGVSYSFMYQYLQSQSFLEEQSSLAGGSVQANFGPTHLKQMAVCVPNDATLIKFNKVCGAFYEQIVANLNQNCELQKLRDSLLPKLMSGEISTLQ